jgi:hypothetical protein
MAKHRTALGKAVDMGRLVNMNEQVRAVSNMKVNARGDTIDAQGRIVVPVAKKVVEGYHRTVTTKADNIVKPDHLPAEVADKTETKVELLPEELEFEDTLDEDLEIEALKVAEEKLNFVVKPASEAPEFVRPEPKKTK